MWWCGEWIDDDLNSARSGLRGDCSDEARPHAPSSPRTDGDVSVGMMFGKSEGRADFTPINVKNM